MLPRRSVATLPFTERQRRFLDLVLRVSGVFVGRQYAAFAGITHGQKVHDFLRRLEANAWVRPMPLGARGRVRLYHVHFKPLYRELGDPDNRFRRRPTMEEAIDRLLVLDGVIADPSVTWLATEREKRAHFAAVAGLDLRDDAYPRLTFGTPPQQTTRYFPDKLPIGHAEYGRRHVFLYPMLRPDLVHFSLFLLRHQQLLIGLSFWTVRVLLPRPLAHLMRSVHWAASQALATPLRTDHVHELEWYFEATAGGRTPGHPDASRVRDARRLFRGPRFIALRRLWQAQGVMPVLYTASHVLRDQMERQWGLVECVVMPRDYGYLRTLARQSPGREADHRGDEPAGRRGHLASGPDLPNDEIGLSSDE